jgi:molecular chaperone IbpA
MLNEMEKFLFSTDHPNGYPPHNIVKLNEEDYVIELAVAGLSKDDLNVEVKENKLFVTHEAKDDDRKYTYKGISNRSFKRIFHLHRDIVVGSADIENGVLKVNLKHVIPEEKKPRRIEIGSIAA